MEHHFQLPIRTSDIKRLHVGDVLYVSGLLFTARDKAHQKLIASDPRTLPFQPSEMALYHCGPLIEKQKQGWKVLSAGPTTSSRMEPFEDTVLETFGVQVIIGKGGMGEKTRKALQCNSAIYAAFPGGAGVVAAQTIVDVPAVYWLEDLGMTEAVWILDVAEFGPLTVAMDSYGHTLYTHR